MNDCRTTYPPQWTPAILRAFGTELSRASRPAAPLPARALQLRVAPPGIAHAGRASGDWQSKAPAREERARPIKTAAHPLALRIPPLAVTLLAGVGAWLAASTSPALRFDPATLPAIAAGFGLLGVGSSILGVISFRRARTTLNPLDPRAASVLVVSGVYRFTRNPMYLGFLFLLLAELAWLGSPVALLAAPAFVVYLNRFQIAPEEIALRERFGAQFVTYTTRVPRWL